MTCPYCLAPLQLDRRIVFPSGPAKLVYTCKLHPNHVLIHEEAGQDPDSDA